MSVLLGLITDLTQKEILLYIVIPILASIIGGGLAFLGVFITIKHEKKINQIEQQNKAMSYFVTYHPNDVPTDFCRICMNKNLKERELISVNIYLHNIGPCFAILNSIVINSMREEIKDAIFNSGGKLHCQIYFDKNIVIENMSIITRDFLGNFYKYNLFFRNKQDSQNMNFSVGLPQKIQPPKEIKTS